jgi:toxin ParE1/3/4
MRGLTWSAEARENYYDILAWIAADSPPAALLIEERIRKTVVDLQDIPTGRISRVSGVYEKLVRGSPYIVAYQIRGNEVVLLRIIHGARDWPAGGWPQN